ncbi:hypothetical protein DVK02_14970 [Halobellus sp. Atlit-31R]|nr:hypothetical protein DVK02_14970 [Halobellus sp. Atlit-31R]
MLGHVARAALYSPFAVLLAFILTRFMSALNDAMAAGEHADADSAQQVMGYTIAAGENFLFVALVSLLVMLLARAVSESEVA